MYNKKYYCFNCGFEMEKEGSTLICPMCGRTWTPKNNYDDSFSLNNYDDDSYYSNKYNGYNETYYERYKGTEYDMGEDWDYDEYPPENL